MYLATMIVIPEKNERDIMPAPLQLFKEQRVNKKRATVAQGEVK